MRRISEYDYRRIGALKCSTSINNMGIPDCVSKDSKRLRELRKLYKAAKGFQEKLTIMAEIKEIDSKLNKVYESMPKKSDGGIGNYTEALKGLRSSEASLTLLEKLFDAIFGSNENKRYYTEEKEVKYKVYPLIFGLSLCIPTDGGKWKLKQQNND